MVQKHRRAQIIDALSELFEQLREDSDDPYDVSEFPLQVKTVQKRYRHWTTFWISKRRFHALLLNYDEVLRKRDGGCEYGVCGV